MLERDDALDVERDQKATGRTETGTERGAETTREKETGEGERRLGGNGIFKF